MTILQFWGLDRIKTVLDLLGNPQKQLKAIHIAGTNGKGSVSAMLANIFKTAGYKTGLFISPYIIDFRERIQINGEYISESDLIEYAERVRKTEITLTEFEFITAIAFLYFKEQNIDILICETGLGGRLDATNSLENKIACVLTKIGLDHTAILGDTIEQITEEKCGILRDCPTVVAPGQERKALNIIAQRDKNAFIPNLKELKITDRKNNIYIYKGKEYALSLKGEFQIENSLAVLETVERSGYDISYNVIYEALASTFIPARMETVSDNPLIILDGAHNPDGAVKLAEELKRFNGEAVAIIGMMRDKAFEDFLKTALIHCKTAIAVTVTGNPRSLSAEELKATTEKYCKCVSAESYFAALETAKNICGNAPIFIFGSLYLAADIRKMLK